MNRPLVTIGITAFNAVDTIEKAVKSAFSQTWRPIEIIAVDDSSTDGTDKALKRMANASSEFRVIQNRVNKGVGFSRNRIVSEARGELIAFFDDDDESMPHRVSTQVIRIFDYERNFAKGAPVICHTARKLRFPDGKSSLEPTMGQREGICAPNGPAVAERILLRKPLREAYGACPCCSQMGRRETYIAIGGFDPDFRRSEDTEFNIRLAKNGGHFVGIAEALVFQKMTKTSDKSLSNEKRYMLMLLQKHRDLADKYGMYEFCRRWIEIKQAWFEKRYSTFFYELFTLMQSQPSVVIRHFALALQNLSNNLAFRRFHLNNRG